MSQDLPAIIQTPDIQKRFNEVLGQNKEIFISSLISISKSKGLERVKPSSILQSAMIAATLKLAINPSLGYAYLVPYKNICTFQLGYKGLIQLAHRSAQYKKIVATPVYEKDIISWDRFKDEIKFIKGPPKTKKVMGYYAYIKLNNGFEKPLVMTIDEIRQHAAKYSQSYLNQDGPWTQHFDAMAIKTVLKKLISRYGILSIDMQTALIKDQSDGDDCYIDNPANINNLEDLNRKKTESGPPEKEREKQKKTAESMGGSISKEPGGKTNAAAKEIPEKRPEPEKREKKTVEEKTEDGPAYLSDDLFEGDFGGDNPNFPGLVLQ